MFNVESGAAVPQDKATLNYLTVLGDPVLQATPDRPIARSLNTILDVKF
ncbi:hypothetical protein QT971_12540 [Microcoleus sp. herbarium19]